MFKSVTNKNQFIDLLLKMLTYLPEKRITAEQALEHPYFSDFHPKPTKKADKQNPEK
jgi:serine/threonine protein kinase